MERLKKEFGKKRDVNRGPVLRVCCRRKKRTVETRGDGSVTMTARSVNCAQETMSLGEGWAQVYSVTRMLWGRKSSSRRTPRQVWDP